MPHREMTNRQVVYTAPPVDADFQPEASFDLTETTITDKIAAGEVLVRNRLLSVDPYHRFGLYDPATAESQFPATVPGTVIGTFGAGTVIATRNNAFPVGAMVYGWLRWENITKVPSTDTQFLEVIDTRDDAAWYLGPLGTPGLTGYAGLTQIGKPKAGETALIPATGGGVGSTAAQVAKHRGLRVVGTAGSADKADELRERFALDEVINHRAGSLEESIRLACPDGIDIYLDLVGGAMLDAALANLNQGARVPCAGMVSQYDLPANQRYRLANLERIVGMDITIQSYRNDTYSDLQAVMRDELRPLLRNEEMAFLTHRSTGVDSIPGALQQVLQGNTTGKRVIDL